MWKGESKAYCNNAIVLKYHIPDTRHDIPPSPIMELRRPDRSVYLEIANTILSHFGVLLPTASEAGTPPITLTGLELR